MKKILYILCVLFALTSCQKEAILTTEGGQNPDGTYTFNLGIEEPDYAPQTRGAVTMGRYMLEMYEGDLTAEPTKQSNATGVFTVEMKKNTDYVCLFWADNGTSYTATDLKAVKQADETALGTAAYFAKVAVNTKNFNGAVTLKRAVAELEFIDKNGLTETTNSLKITYPYASATLNVGDGTVTHATGSAVRTISGITPPAAATTAFATDFVFAPTAAGKLAGLKFQLNTQAEKTIAETAIQANYRTQITGEYQPKPVPKPAYKVGDLYPNATAPIGVVFWVDEADPSYDATAKTSAKGKIVGLTEPEANWNGSGLTVGKLTWGPKPSITNAKNEENGAANMAAIKALYATFVDYPAFAWAESQNTPAIAGISWYLPAKLELKQLYAAMSGLKLVASGAGIGEINDWGDAGMPNNATYADSRIAFNGKFTAATGTKIDLTNAPYYWSSTEGGSTSFAWNIGFDHGSMGVGGKNGDNASVRVVSAF